MFAQSYSFSFEAAHELGAAVDHAEGHPYGHVHGHSFEVTVTLKADKAGPKGWIEDFAVVRAACDGVRDRLDHRFLNKIDGLAHPTLENIAVWVFDALKPTLPALSVVELARPSLRERVAYTA